MQATCLLNWMFLDVEIKFPGAASEFYAFDESALKKKVETEGFLRPGLCLFGDNAYTNTPYMCIPWQNIGSGPKDAFNLFQLQVQINIKCVLGCWYTIGESCKNQLQ